MNMVARIGDEIVTPPLGGSILAGVTRDSAITLLREWGLAVNERPLGMEELSPPTAAARCARSLAAAPPRSSRRSGRSAGRAKRSSSTAASLARSHGVC